jgi:hypothetical protein
MAEVAAEKSGTEGALPPGALLGRDLCPTAALEEALFANHLALQGSLFSPTHITERVPEAPSLGSAFTKCGYTTFRASA